MKEQSPPTGPCKEQILVGEENRSNGLLTEKNSSILKKHKKECLGQKGTDMKQIMKPKLQVLSQRDR